MKINDLDGAAKNNSGLRRALLYIETWATALETKIGVEAISVASNANKGKGVAPPPLCSFTAQGATGRFIITITVPSSVAGPVVHQIKTSSTLPFAASPDVITYPDNPSTIVEIYEGDVSKFIQVRSRYYTSDYNAPVVTISNASAGDSGSVPTTAGSPVGFHPLDPDYRFTNGGC